MRDKAAASPWRRLALRARRAVWKGSAGRPKVAASSGDPLARKMLALIFSRPLQGGVVDVAWMQQLAGLRIGTNGSSPGMTMSAPPNGWQREPSPLYHLIPLQWRGEDARPAVVR